MRQVHLIWLLQIGLRRISTENQSNEVEEKGVTGLFLRGCFEVRFAYRPTDQSKIWS